MKFIKLYEEFIAKTLKTNIDAYNDYLNKYKDNRSWIVAWEAEGSQQRNFRMVSKYIENGDTILDYGCGVGDFIQHLKDNEINISNYLGVDINSNFIKLAKNTYPDYKFKVIKNVNSIKGKWDTVCAIGVFTWFITKEEFIETIHKLHDISNKRVLLTFLNDRTPYDYGYDPNNKYDLDDEDNYWNDEYKKYSTELFKTLFPELKISYEIDRYDTLLVKIDK